MSESDVLEAMTVESVRRVTAQFGAESPVVDSTHDRRTFFEATDMLSTAAFRLDQGAARA